MLTADFVEERRNHLLMRRASKIDILNGGGQQALSHSRKDIVRIDFALKRIQEQQYGICVNCGTLIEEDRLILIPETPFCASCARSIEAQ